MPASRPKDFVGVEFQEALAAVRGTTQAMSFVAVPTPEELLAVYNRGFQGVRPDTTTPEQKTRWRTMMAAMPSLYDIFPWAHGLGKGKINCSYTAIWSLDPDWGGRDPQERGDCTVHGTRNGGSIDYAIDAIFGEAKFMGPLAVENIYRYRGRNGDGWSCEAPCTIVGPDGPGGLLYRTVYSNPSNPNEQVDLSKYNPSWEGDGVSGCPKWLEEISRQNKVKWVIPIRTAEEYRDAIALGFGINVCSGQGFASSTDENGVAKASGSWSHAMAHVACIDTDWARNKYSDMIGGIQQSWGNWNKINGKPEGSPNMPIGMFYAKMAPILDMLSGDDSYAMCGVWGFDRTSWEAFVSTDMPIKEFGVQLADRLRNSTTQDYYKQRSEWLEESVKKAAETHLFTGV